MSERTVWYRVITQCEESFYALRVTQSDFDSWMAQKAARHYHALHDGWEANWPLVFSLHEWECGPEMARFEVQRDFEPVFYAAAMAKAGESQ